MRLKPWSFSSFPLGFQEKVFIEIKRAVQKGISIQLVGAPGIGNTILARLLTYSTKVQKKYFSKMNVRFLVLDSNLLLERDSLTLYRLLLSLFGQQQDISNDNIKLVRLLEDKIKENSTRGGLVLIIDHLQDLDHEELKPFFASLSYFHSKFRYNLSFIFISEKPYMKHSEMTNFAGLSKLIAENIVYTPCLNKKDSLWLINDTEKLVSINLSKSEHLEIFRYSGGFPRTIKRLVEGASKGFSLDELLNNPALYPALLVHLEELSEYEYLAEDIPILSQYKHVGLTGSDSETVGGITLTSRLTKMEEKLMKYFLLRENEIVDRESGISAIWGDNGNGISDHAYDQIVHRLRKKMKNSSPSVDLSTVRGRGHKLIIG